MQLTFEGFSPQVGRDVFIASNAVVLGQVTCEQESSIWYGCVLRGDIGRIHIGPRTNVQDGTIIHVTGGKFDTLLEHDITVGHRVLLHGCRVAHHVLLGMGSIVLDDVHIPSYCIVAAGAVVTSKQKLSERSLLMGAPARVVRPLRQDEIENIDRSAEKYVRLAAAHQSLKEATIDLR